MSMESNHPGRVSQGDEPGRDEGSQHLCMRRRVSKTRELHIVVTALQGRGKGRILRSSCIEESRKKNCIIPISLRPYQGQRWDFLQSRGVLSEGLSC